MGFRCHLHRTSPRITPAMMRMMVVAPGIDGGAMVDTIVGQANWCLGWPLLCLVWCFQWSSLFAYQRYVDAGDVIGGSAFHLVFNFL